MPANAATSGPTSGPAWVARYDGPTSGWDTAKAIVASPEGSRVYVTGSSAWNTGEDYITIAYNARTGSRMWTGRYDGPGHGQDVATALALSPDASKLFVTGYSTGLDRYHDYATIAYDATTGSPLWHRRYSGAPNGYDEASAIAVTPDGSKILVTGQSDGPSIDYATIAYDSVTGAPLWLRRLDGTGHGWDVAKKLALSPDGSTAYVAGEADMRTGGSDYVTEALSVSTGAVLWLNDYRRSSSAVDLAEGLALTPDGSKIFVTGSSSGPTGFDFDTVAIDTSTGTLLWERLYDGPSAKDDSAGAIAVSPDGAEVFVTGYSNSGVINIDYATVAYSADTGDPLWLRRYDGSDHNSDFPQAISVSPDGVYVYVTGWSRSADTLDDYATVAYGVPDGRIVGVRLYDGPGQGDDHGLAIASTARQVFVTGESDGGATDYDYATAVYVI